MYLSMVFFPSPRLQIDDVIQRVGERRHNVTMLTEKTILISRALAIFVQRLQITAGHNTMKTVVLCFFKLYFIRVTASASLDPDASLFVFSHNTLHLYFNDTIYIYIYIYMRLEKIEINKTFLEEKLI